MPDTAKPTGEVTVAVYGPNLPTRGEQIHVHAPGCADTRRAFYAGQTPWRVDVASTVDLAAAVYPPEDFEYDAGDDAQVVNYLGEIKVFPCVAPLPFRGAA